MNFQRPPLWMTSLTWMVTASQFHLFSPRKDMIIKFRIDPYLSSSFHRVWKLSVHATICRMCRFYSALLEALRYRPLEAGIIS